MSELFVRLCEAEGFIDFVPLALVANQRTGVALVFQNPRHHLAAPDVSNRDAVMGAGRTLMQQFKLHLPRCFAFSFVEHLGNHFSAHPAKIAVVDQTDSFRSLVDNHHLLRILVLEIPEGRNHNQAVFLLLPVAGTHTPAAVPGVEIVYQSLEADDEIVVLVEGINVLRRGQDADVMLPKVIDEQRGLRPVASQPGQVLDDDCFDLSFLYDLVDFIDPRPVEMHSADVIVEGFANYFMSIADCEVENNLPLVRQGIQFIVLIAGEPVV